MQTQVRFRYRVDIILPIVIALIAPGLSALTNTENALPKAIAIVPRWILGSVLIYGFWQFLWFSWRLELKYKILWLISGLLINTMVIAGVNYHYENEFFQNLEWLYIFRIVMGSIIFLSIQYSLRNQQSISNLQLEKEQIETDKYKAQLKTLRTQVNPHFLFNSLNTLRSMVRQNHNNSEQFIMSLSDFYRQTLKHNDHSTLPLSEELDVLKSYLFLMSCRNADSVKVNIDIDEKLLQYSLPALSLQIVVENCFKHNTMTSKSPLYINILNADDDYIEVNNNVQPKIGQTEPSGYGLDLLTKRYDLMKVSNGLMVNQTTDQFSVRLKLVQL